MAVGIEDGEHVGVNDGLSMLAAEEGEGEADQLFSFFVFVFFFVEGADKNIAGRFAGDGQGEGHGVVVGHAPDFFLDRFELAEVGDGLEVANGDLLGRAAGHHGWAFAQCGF